MLSKHDEAKDYFSKANKLTGGKDKDIEEKLKYVKKFIREREFALALIRDDDLPM